MKHPTEEEIEEYLNKHCPYRRLGNAMKNLQEALLDDLELRLRKLISFTRTILKK